ncbi:hypothetical protein M8J76_008390 [Diaphorina citri]|nr:hypothetical protein M8J75_006724 [Diaphorina citri]KAI5745121.1 hypothetical protein M8J76_008390 [Diaphorina citri]KAI5752272.1 hypothetical protein M8J77_015436 [Diaphorina citri]
MERPSSDLLYSSLLLSKLKLSSIDTALPTPPPQAEEKKMDVKEQSTLLRKCNVLEDPVISTIKNYINMDEKNEVVKRMQNLLVSNVHWKDFLDRSNQLNEKIKHAWKMFDGRRKIIESHELKLNLKLRAQREIKEEVDDYEMKTPILEQRTLEMKHELEQIQQFPDFLDNFVKETNYDTIFPLIRKYAAMKHLQQYVNDQQPDYLKDTEIKSDLRNTLIQGCRKFVKLHKPLHDIANRCTQIKRQYNRNEKDKCTNLKLCAKKQRESNRIHHNLRYLYNSKLRPSESVRKLVGYVLPELDGSPDELVNMLKSMQPVYSKFNYGYGYTHILGLKLKQTLGPDYVPNEEYYYSL